MNEIEKAIQFFEESLIGAIAFGDAELVGANKIALAALRKELEAQRNDPLTMEELREIDGEPVYVESTDRTKLSGWRIVFIDKKRDVGFASGYFCTLRFSDYGKTWLAYRREPEVGGSTHAKD